MGIHGKNRKGVVLPFDDAVKSRPRCLRNMKKNERPLIHHFTIEARLCSGNRSLSEAKVVTKSVEQSPVAGSGRATTNSRPELLLGWKLASDRGAWPASAASPRE